MKNIQRKFKPLLKKEGVFYSNPCREDSECIIVLEEINKEAKCIEDCLNKNREVLGFRAYHKITGNPYPHNVLISKEIGNPAIYLITDENEPVDYASNLEFAISKAHEYIFNEIIDGILRSSSGAYNSLLDKTKAGLCKFNKNKANLSAENKKSPNKGSVVDMEKYSKLEREFGFNSENVRTDGMTDN